VSRSRLTLVAAVLAPLLLFLVRFDAFLRGGVLAFRDAGFFFVPWRTLLARQLAAGVFPWWNDALSAGRPFAADPNAALFWPLTPLLLWLSPTVLALVNAAVALLLCFVAARLAGLSALAGAAAASVLLFSGVFQTLPLLFTSLCSAAPLPIALVAAGRLARGEGRGRRLVTAIGIALALSALGGEPALAAIGGAGTLVVLLFAGGARRLPALALAGALAVSLAAVQVFPTLGLLARAARGRTERAEAAALTFSVRPGRLLTLLEPRLVGDPFAESDLDYWGAGTFDAGNPYFYDVALGLVPLLFALAAAADRRARPFLGAAAVAALLSFGRFLPGLGAVLGGVSVFRFPEKWWLLTTLGLVLASASCADGIARGETRERLALSLRNVSWGAATLLSIPLLLAVAAPGAVRDLLWGMGLGAGATPPARIAGLLLPRLAAGALSALLVALLAGALLARRISAAPLLSIAAVLFLVDAVPRVTGTLPAGAPDLYARESDEVRVVLSAQGKGRFYDDGADRKEVAVARAVQAGGLDPLRPATGTVFGVRYAAENDIDRMTSRASFAFAREAVALPWGAEKVGLLRRAGVTVARTADAAPDPAGVRTLARFGGDRIVAIDGSREEFSLAGGRVRVFRSAPDRQELDVDAGSQGGRLEIARTFDPGWRVAVDGACAPLLAEGSFMGLALPPGPHHVTLVYRDPLFAWGGLVSLLAFGAAAVLARP
jgi:hypothetical protein